jgi:DNA replication protein DnaC
MDISSKDSHTTKTICPICNGARFVHPLLASGKPDYNRIVPCQCIQDEILQEKSQYLEQYSNLGALSHLTFDTLSPQGKTKDIITQGEFAQAYKAAKSFADHPEGWLILLGPSGCGKTHLACATANQRLALGQAVFYISAADLLDHMRSAFSPTSNASYDEIFEKVKNAPLLILDDLTTQSTTPWAKEKLEQLLSYRFDAKLATVITSDVALEKMDERLRRHITDSNFCQAYRLEQEPSLVKLDNLQLKLLKQMTFDNFDHKRLELPPEQRQNLRQAFHLAEEFSHSPEGWLIFQGVNGCGKTHLAAAIGNYQLTQGKPVFFIVVPDLLDYLRSTFSPQSNISYDESFENIKKIPLLILDDFGEQAATPWAQEKLYQLINYRYNAKAPTVITTCLSLDEIESRISSRMVDPQLSLVFNIMAPDYRGNIKPSKRSTRY